jgi:hypothetical protein
MPKKSVPFDNLTRGHQFDGGPFALDLYRLLGMVLSDKRIASLGDETSYLMQPIWLLQERFRKAELLRILVSSAVALRILFDQKRDPREQRFKTVSRKPCGFLWPNLPKRQREVLTIREACNKIIHATDVIDKRRLIGKRRGFLSSKATNSKVTRRPSRAETFSTNAARVTPSQCLVGHRLTRQRPRSYRAELRCRLAPRESPNADAPFVVS